MKSSMREHGKITQSGLEITCVSLMVKKKNKDQKRFSSISFIGQHSANM